MTREERAKAWAAEVYRSSNFVFADKEGYYRFICDIERAYLQGAKDADTHPAWRMCEDEMPTDPHQPYWVYAKCCGECCVAYIQEKTNIFYDEGGEELSGVVAWLPLPKFNIKAAEL